MRILHTSDWHLGMPAGIRSQEEDQRYFLDQLYKIVEEQKIDAVILAGDVYDSSISNANAIAMYNEAVTRICKDSGVPMVVIAGNHDGAARLASCRELLMGSGLYVTGRLARQVEPVILTKTGEQDVAIYPVPFFNREEVAAFYPEERKELTSQEKAMLSVCTKIREAMDKERVNILTAHAMIVSAELSESDRAARVGMAAAVSKDVFEGFDYVALGHIHKPQKITEKIRYSGSPVKYSFGNEEKTEKCVLIYDTVAKTVEEYPLELLHDRKTVHGTLEEILADESLKGAWLRLFVTDRYAGLDLLGQLQETFPYMLELFGKSTEEVENQEALTIDQLEKMDEMDIMMKFCAENFTAAGSTDPYIPGKEQIQLFQDVLAWCEEEGDLS